MSRSILRSDSLVCGAGGARQGVVARNEHNHSMVLNLQRFVPAGASEASNGQEDSLTASIQAFDPETTVTFVRKEAERTLNGIAPAH